MSRYLVTEKDGTGHLPVRDSDDGPLNHHLMGAAWAALHGGYRGNKYQGPNKQSAIAKLKALYKSEGMELPTEASDFRLKSDDCRLKTRFAVVLAGPGRPIENHQSSIGNLHEIPICVTGTWVKNSHKFSITAEDLADMVRNFDKRKNDQVVIDYEHASEQPEVAKGGPIPAAGWIHVLRVGAALVAAQEGHPQGVPLLASVEWTPDAARMIQGGQYRFFSPAIDWNFSDKETGKSQGATLTSGALTNHPFLEELPPITLTESGVVLADISTGYLDGPVGAGPRACPGGDHRESPLHNSNGGRMGSKKLSICKMDGADKFDGAQFDGAAGHHGIFDGDDFLGHVHADDMKDHVKSCMGDGFGDLDDLAGGKGADGGAKGQAGVKGHQQKDADMSELLRESGFRFQASGVSSVSSADCDVRYAVLSGLKLAATHQLVEHREASRNLLLSECLKPSPGPSGHPLPGGEGQGVRGGFDTEKAKQLLRDKKIDAADLLDAIEAKGMLDDAIAKGKVLPKDRAFFFEIAFNHPEKFTDYIAGAVPVLAFGSVGIGSTENMPVDQEVDVEAKKLMSEKNIGYGKAMKELFKVNPALEQRYRDAHRTEPRRDAPVDGITQ